ncbi:uncharacterized protein TRUGW13939_04808 [Talaromyces rugulosus]|uniref:AB hydrolase-1 domain-containing protein n=1 Tax=Talaromyces rugulosus TaxID=121627 RepID=A0A7H8QUK8_TALRU|nr:uncharacterized protein TRUGW13939_04808 [Talaromyces rugulosus]QKX57690.1 hypothetical protein TRUGW13939_04808 [Talaromyces rugulosus]
MLRFKLMSLTWLVPLVHASLSVPVCSSVSFQVTATADNAIFLSPPSESNETAVLDFFYDGLGNGTGAAVKGSSAVSGTYRIDGTYCRPSISSISLVWSRLGSEYNWQSYAAGQGYLTLAIDRLGHGSNQQHPDPVNIVQGTLDIELEHQLINTLRNDKSNALGRTFDTIAFVSHSYARWLAMGLAYKYPSDINALVLTGFSASVDFSPFVNTTLESASLLEPLRYGSLPLGYITTKEESQRKELFYAGNYSRAVVLWDYLWQDTWTIGETGSLGFTRSPTGFTGALYLATGVDDILFCQTPLSECETILNNTRAVFPAVTKFGYVAVENTGHVLMMHNSAQQTFADVHTFLDQAL